MDEALRFSQSHGVRAGCQALDLPPSSLYREKLRRERPALDPRPRAASPRALSPPEREAVVEVLHSRQFIDKAPAAAAWQTGATPDFQSVPLDPALEAFEPGSSPSSASDASASHIHCDSPTERPRPFAAHSYAALITP